MEIADNIKSTILEYLQEAEECLGTSIDSAKSSLNNDVAMTNNMECALSYMSSIRNLLRVNDIASKHTTQDIAKVVVECDTSYDDYEVDIPEDSGCEDMYGLTANEDQDVKTLRWTIDVRSGNVEGWPKGMTASTNFKFTDCGVYTLLAEDGTQIRKYEDYVPTLFNIKEEEYGDYLHVDIDANGHIVGWEQATRHSQSSPDGTITLHAALHEMLWAERRDLE